MDKKDPRNEKLIEELYERLDWHTFLAPSDEYNTKEVEAILNLLEELDPWPEAVQKRLEKYGKGPSAGDKSDQAFERFKERYKLTDADIAKKDATPSVPFTEENDPIRLEELENSAELGLDPELVRKLLAKEREFGTRKNGLTQTLNGGSAAVSTTGCYSEDVDTEMSAGMKENKKSRVRFFTGVWAKIAVACIIVVVMGVVFTTGGSAVQQKSFFETVQDGYNSIRMIVTGNEMEMETMDQENNDIVYYDSWDQVKEENSEILVPTYIPEGVELEELYRLNMGNYTYYKGAYRDEKTNVLSVLVQDFNENYAEMEVSVFDNWIYLYDEDGKRYYQFDGRYDVIWKRDSCIYTIEWMNLNEIKDIAEKMK